MRKILLAFTLNLMVLFCAASNSIQTTICKRYQDNDPSLSYYYCNIQATDSTGKITYRENMYDFLAPVNCGWANVNRIDYTYDSLGRLTVELFSSIANNVVTNGARNTYTYNNANFLIQVLNEQYSTNTWTLNKKSDFNYDTLGNLLSQNDYRYQNGWIPTYEVQNVYDSHLKIISKLILEEVFIGGTFDTTGISQYTHIENTSGLDSILYSVYFADPDTLQYCENFNYDNQNRIILYKKTQCPNGNCTDSLLFKSYSYSNNDTTLFFLHYQSFDSTWVADRYTHHNFNTNIQETYFDDVSYNADGQEFTFTYDSLDRLYSKIGTSWPDNFHPTNNIDCYSYYSNDSGLSASYNQPFLFCYPQPGMVIFNISGGQSPYVITIQNLTSTSFVGGKIYLPSSIYMQPNLIYTVTDAIGNTFQDSLKLNLPIPQYLSNPIIGQNSLCAGESRTYYTSYSGPFHRWFLDGMLLGSSDSVTISNPGTLVLSTYCVQNNGACVASDLNDSIFITYDTLPSLSIGNDTVICQSQSIDLIASSGFSTYLWQDSTIAPSFHAAYLAGSSDSLLCTLIATDSLGCSTSDSAWVVFDICAGINSPKSDKPISISPSPSTGLLNLNYTLSYDARINIIDCTGRIIIDSKLSCQSNSTTFDLSEYKSGIYFCRIFSGNEIVFQNKIVLKN